MTTSLQIALLAGGLIGLGLSLLAWRVRPAQVDLATALERLSPDRSLGRAPTEGPREGGAEPDARDRLGRWVMRALPLDSLGAPPYRELALMRVPVHRFYGEKALFALLGAFLPFVLLLVARFVGFGVPWFYGVVGAVIGGVGNRILGRHVVSASRDAFGPAPAVFPMDLHPDREVRGDDPADLAKSRRRAGRFFLLPRGKGARSIERGGDDPA